MKTKAKRMTGEAAELNAYNSYMANNDPWKGYKPRGSVFPSPTQKIAKDFSLYVAIARLFSLGR